MADFSQASAEFDAAEAAKTTEAPAQQSVEQPEPTSDQSTQHSFQSVDDAVAELKKVRAEAAERRVALKPYEETFGQYSDDDRQVWFQLANLLAQDQSAGAKAMKELAEALLGDETNTEQENTVSDQEKGAAEQAAEAAEALTPDKVQEIVQKTLTEYDQEKTQRTAQQQKLETLRTQAKELGYEPDSVEYSNLLYFAANETEGDLKAAHEKVEAWKANVVKSFTEQKAQKADRTAKTPESGHGTPAPEAPESPKDFKSARERMVQFLNEQAQASSQGA